MRARAGGRSNSVMDELERVEELELEKEIAKEKGGTHSL